MTRWLKWAGLAAGAAIAAAAVASCGSARRGAPIAGAFTAATESQLAGRQVFMRACHECHPGGMAGLGPAINDKPLPRWLIRMQVRRGLGAMPAIDERKLPDEELELLLDYLDALRDHG